MRTGKCEYTGKQIHLCGCEACVPKMKKIAKALDLFLAHVKQQKNKGVHVSIEIKDERTSHN